MVIKLKRAYDPPSRSDGARILVDRLWPRGISKEAAKLTEWMRDLAPSDDLRKWYHEHTTQWPTFRKRYLAELSAPEALSLLEKLHNIAENRSTTTLIYTSRNEIRNHANVLKDLLEGARKPPTGTGPAKASAVPQRARGRR